MVQMQTQVDLTGEPTRANRPDRRGCCASAQVRVQPVAFRPGASRWRVRALTSQATTTRAGPVGRAGPSANRILDASQTARAAWLAWLLAELRLVISWLELRDGILECRAVVHTLADVADASDA
jgi:hypothetical protein